jgi:hypothetical protein
VGLASPSEDVRVTDLRPHVRHVGSVVGDDPYVTTRDNLKRGPTNRQLLLLFALAPFGGRPPRLSASTPPYGVDLAAKRSNRLA